MNDRTDRQEWVSDAPRTLAPWRYVKHPGALNRSPGSSVRDVQRDGPAHRTVVRQTVWFALLLATYAALLLILLR